MKRILAITILLTGLVLFAQSNPKRFQLKNQITVMDSTVTHIEVVSILDSAKVIGHLGFYRDTVFVNYYPSAVYLKSKLLNYADSLVTQ